MSLWEIFLLALALAADAFSVGAAVGLVCQTRRQIFRLSFHFGLFQFLFAAGGALLGRFLYDVISGYDRWVAFFLLSGIGIHMILEASRKKPDCQQTEQKDPTCGATLVGLSTAVSIDAFGAGIGIALALSPWRLFVACLVIGGTASLATLTAMRLGNWISKKLGFSAEIFGGVVIILLGIRILVG